MPCDDYQRVGSFSGSTAFSKIFCIDMDDMLFSSLFLEPASALFFGGMAMCGSMPSHRTIDTQCDLPLQAEDIGSKELGLAEGRGGKSKQERSSGAQDVEQPPVAGQVSSIFEVAAPESLLAPTAPAQSSEVTASSRTSSLRSQPCVPLLDDTPHEQQGRDLPSRAAPAARAAPCASPEGEPWQEVRPPRRKPVSQQAASKASTRKAPKHGMGVLPQQLPAPSQPRLRVSQAAAQHAEQAPMNSDKALGTSHTQSGHVAAKQFPHPLPASAGRMPWRPSQHKNHSSLQPPQIQAIPLSMQHEPFQATADATAYCETHKVLQQRLHPWPSSKTSSHVQVHMLTWTESTQVRHVTSLWDDHLCLRA